MRRLLAGLPAARPLFHALVPRGVWDRAKSRLWRMPQRPELSEAVRRRLEVLYDEDLAELGRWLGLELSCARYAEIADRPDPRWCAGVPALETAGVT